MPDRLRFRLLLLAALVLFAACAKPPELIGVGNQDTQAESLAGTSKHRIFIATSRSPSQVEGQFYSTRRSATLGLAAVTVSVPPDRTPGTINRPRRLPPDATREFAVVEPERFEDGGRFVRALNTALAARGPQDRDVLVFIHGFNNTLSDAVLRVAQFMEDSGFDGVPVLFSWASAGRVSRYAYDLNSVLAARLVLQEASSLIIQSNATGYDVFAHSMGTMLVTEAMVQSDLQGTLGSSGKLKNILFAAPDIDVDVFRSQIGQIRETPGNLYVLISRDDRALRLSRRVAGGIDRVGAADVEELEGLGLTIIDLSGIDDSSSGSHTKFAGSPEVVQLVGRTLSTHGYSDPSGNLVSDALTLLPGSIDVVRP